MIENGIGRSQYTIFKNENFALILKTQLAIVKQIFKKNYTWLENTFYYIDANAGEGSYAMEDGSVCLGSPIVALAELHKSDLRHEAYLIEISKDNCKKLRDRLSQEEFYGDCVNVHHGDQYEILPGLLNAKDGKRKRLGMLYTDPSGTPPDFNLLTRISHNNRFEQIDFLIYCSATNIKRIIGAGNDCIRLKEAIETINKKYWLIREPMGRHQWTFILGTNWKGFPQFEKIGLYQVTTEKGQEILKRLNYTNKELGGAA